MNFDEAILHALNGDSILFAGSGFCYNAVNMDDEQFKIGAELAKKIIEKGNLNEEGEEDLGYLSEVFVEEQDIYTLIKLLRKEFTCKKYTESHKNIASINWKRIYTTNYDNIIEKSSIDAGKHRSTATVANKLKDYIDKNDIVIHLNGYIENLNEDTIWTDFKLTNTSYRNSDEFNQWKYLLSDDLNNAKSVFFVGYSLEYDESIQELIAATDELKEKCFFITFNPSKKSLRLMNRFGQVQEIGVDGFGEKIQEKMIDFKPLEIPKRLMCFEKYKAESYGNYEITDKDFTDLIFYGKLANDNLVRNSDKYILKRDVMERVISELRSDVQLEIITSDLGNGKTIFLEQLKSELCKYGDVYTLKEMKNYFNEDLDVITNSGSINYIFIENYNLYLSHNNFKYLNYYKNKGLRFIFSARTFINDNFYAKLVDKLNISEEFISIKNLNKLTNNEVDKFISLIDNYNLWGRKAAESKNEKKKFIQAKCNSEIKNILLDLFETTNISNKINRIVEQIKNKKNLRDLLIVSFINRIINLNISLSDMLLVLKLPRLGADVTQNKYMNEFFKFKSNEIEIKSAIVGYYIFQNNDFDQEIVDILVRMTINISGNSCIFKYREIMRLILSFSNLRIVLNAKSENFANNVITFYEKTKNLSFNKSNPFFWYQYAIARMDIKDYKTARLYLDAAYSYAQKEKSQDAYQLDSHKARFLLESTLYYRKNKEAFNNFMEAHELIYYNSNKPANLHYPLKQVGYYYEFYIQFYKNFEKNQKALFMMACHQVKDKINEYSEAIKNEDRSRHREIINIEKKIDYVLEEIRKTMDKESSLDSELVLKV